MKKFKDEVLGVLAAQGLHPSEAEPHRFADAVLSRIARAFEGQKNACIVQLDTLTAHAQELESKIREVKETLKNKVFQASMEIQNRLNGLEDGKQHSIGGHPATIEAVRELIIDAATRRAPEELERLKNEDESFMKHFVEFKKWVEENGLKYERISREKQKRRELGLVYGLAFEHLIITGARPSKGKFYRDFEHE